jgi:Trk-type K+ transport system membrane component
MSFERPSISFDTFNVEHMERPSVSFDATEPPPLELLRQSKRLRRRYESESRLRKVAKYLGIFANFWTTHMTYFIVMSFIGSACLVISEDIPYIDALFISSSALTATGLITRDFAQFNYFSQVIVLFELIVGGHVMLYVPPLVYRLINLLRHKDDLEGQTIIVPKKLPFLSVLSPGARKFLPCKRWRKPQLQAEDHIDVDEYSHKKRVLLTLILVVFTYWIVVNSAAAAILMIHASLSPSMRVILHTRDINPTFYGVLMSVAGFTNGGFSVFSDSLITVNQQWVPIVVIGLLILLGYTAFPVAIRLVFRILYQIDNDPQRKLVYGDILTYPRRYFSHMFGSRSTWWLVFTLILFNFGQWGITMALEWNLSPLEGLPGGYKALNCLFQSIATRLAGFNSIGIAESHPAVLVMYVAMMYVSAFPVLISMRQSNVDEVAVDGSRSSRVIKQFKNIVALDMVTLATALFFITLFQSDSFVWQTNYVDDYGQLLPGDVEGTLTLYALIFEIVSAYGCVGLSMGVQSYPYSLAGALNPWSKMVLIFMMWIGRQRHLPHHADPAVRSVNYLIPVNK